MLDHTDLGMNLDEAYISHQLARTLDFRDDQNTKVLEQITSGCMSMMKLYSYQWPMYYDASYSPTSTAATHSTSGGPIGSNRWMDFELGELSTDTKVSYQ